FGEIVEGEERVNQRIKGVEWSCEDAGGLAGKVASCATVLLNWGRGKVFGQVDSFSPWGWEGLILTVQLG
nr:hypothetical protein [Tanacetum cinerariifolium]